MSILSICVTAVVSVALTLTVKRHNQELAILISIGCSVIILLSLSRYLLESIDSIRAILSSANINSNYIVILLKVIGICFITEFTCDCTKEAGLDSLTGNLALAGKILVLITSMPMFFDILSMVTKLCGGDSHV